ncbi:MAG: BTAD domain-containing putative transcriptional regulator [Acidimicrobiia bacterium]
MMEVEFGVLGLIEARRVHEPFDIGGPRQRRLLAVLLVNARDVVSRDRLIHAVWGEDAPDEAAATLRTYVARLRKALVESGADTTEGSIRTSPLGYVLDVDPGSIDAGHFEALVAQGRRSLDTDPLGALDKLDEGLSLWRGAAYEEFAHEDWARPDAVRLEELKLSAVELRVDAALACGLHDQLVPELETLILEHPLRERMRAQLMTALYRSGRQAEALRAYQQYRSYLGEEVGLEPSEALRTLEGQIATRDAALSLKGRTGRSLRGYQLGDLIGTGAFGEVYHAVQSAVNRDVAVKVINSELANDPRFIRRFELEAQAVAGLEHPYVVPLYDYWREPDAAYLVMRYLRGGSIRDRLATGPFDVSHVGRVVEQVGSALATAHRSGLIHRDVQPSNILLDEDGNAYLADFGVASGVVDDTYPALSSPVYASPGQLRGLTASPADDIYSLAAVAFEMAAGSAPYPTDTPVDDLVRTLDENGFPPLSRSRPDLPLRVSDVIRRATSQDPEIRYDEMTAFVVDFTDAIGRSGGAVATPSTDIENPYKGLHAFLESDSLDFFGRDGLVAELEMVLERGSRFIAVVGPSGSGKSSVVRAGLVPRLRSGAVTGSDLWFITTMLPGSHPFEELEAALLRVAVNPPASLLDQLTRDTRGVSGAIKRILPPDGKTELVLIIDQFEELFSQVDPDVGRRFADAITAAVQDDRCPLRVISTIRADFYDRPLRIQGLGELVKTGTVPAAAMSPRDLEQAIVGPARRVGVEVEPAVVAEIISEVAHDSSALPLVEFALTELFDLRVDGTMTGDAYRRIGGVTGAMVRRADDVYERSSPTQRDLARRLFGRLVTIGEGTEDTRRRTTREELAGLHPEMDSVIDAFGDARLLAFDHDPATRAPTVAIAHEAFLREWAPLRSWIEDDREDLRARRRLTTAIQEWTDSGSADGFLLRGVLLARYEGWVENPPVSLTTDERTFVEASFALQSAEERTSRRRRRSVLAGLTAAAILASLLAVFALAQRGDARRQSDIAEAEAAAAVAARTEAETRRMSEEAVSRAEENRRLSLLLAAEVFRRDPGPETLGALQRSMIRMENFLGYLGSDRAYIDAGWIDDDRIVAVREDGVDVYDTTTGRTAEVEIPVRWSFEEKPNFTSFVAFAVDPIAGIAAVGSTDGQIYLLDGDGSEIGRLTSSETTRVLTFSQDGKSLASGDLDGRLQVWDVESRGLRWETMAHPEGWEDVALPDGVTWAPELGLSPEKQPLDGVRAIAFSPDGRVIATGSGPLLRRWDAGTGAQRGDDRIASFDGVTGIFPLLINSMEYDPIDPGVIVTGSGSAAVRWNVETGERLGTLWHPTGRSDTNIQQAELAFTADDRAVVALSDGRIVVYDAAGVPDGEGLAAFISAGGRIGAIADSASNLTLSTQAPGLRSLDLSPTGDRFVVATGEGLTIGALNGDRLLATAVPRGPGDKPTINSTGTGVISATRTPGGDRLWDISDGPPKPVPFDLMDAGSESAFDPDPLGLTINVYGPDAEGVNRFRLVDGETLKQYATIPCCGVGVAYGSDGRLIANGNDPAGIYVSDQSDGATVTTIAMPAPVRMLDFDAGANRLLASTFFGDFFVWDTTSWEQVGGFEGLGGTVVAGYSPGGRYLITGTEDGNLMLRDPQNGEPIQDLLGAHDASEVFAFGPFFSRDDGLVVSIFDGLPRLWDTATGIQIGDSFPNDEGIVPGGAEGAEIRLVTGVGEYLLVWNLDTESWLDIACRAVGRNLTRDEWDKFGPADTEYRATCPQYGIEG